MPRSKSYTSEVLVKAAMIQFWHHGYRGTSMADLVQATGVSRHGIYEGFTNKYGLFHACLTAYQDAVVTAAFRHVEAKGAGLAAIATYFEAQIEAGMSMQPSPPGCLMANTMTELGPHDAETAAFVEAHHARLMAGFTNALSNEAGAMPKLELSQLANFLTVSAQGLWSFSRTAPDRAILTTYTNTLLSLIAQRLTS